MQDPLADSDQCRRVGVDEKYINFRSSPNFKNMKKFLKSKIDYNETTDQSSSDSIPDTIFSSVMKENKPEIYPPLPRDPPPSDSPPIKTTTDKGTEKSNTNTTTNGDLFKNLHLKPEKDDSPTKSDKQEICKDFTRGTCTRPKCIYSHEITFCHDFQNSVCTHPNCRFVHATVFEEAAYHRRKKKQLKSQLDNTEDQKVPKVNIINDIVDKPLVKFKPTASLMPNNNIIKNNIACETPLIKPNWPENGGNVLATANLMTNNNIKNTCETPVIKPNWPENGGNVSVLATANLMSNNIKNTICESPVIKPNWPENGGNVNCPPITREIQPKKCDSCNLLENRLQHAKRNAEKMAKSMEEFYEGIAMLRRKKKRLQAVMMLLQSEAFNQQNNATSSNAASKINGLGPRNNM